MDTKRKKIRVILYTYTARRVFLFASPILYKVLKPFTIDRDEYNKHSKAIINVLHAIEDTGFKEDITLIVRPFWIFFLFAFYKGAYKPPIVIVGHKVFSAGVIPNKEKLKIELKYYHSKETFLKD